jgi:MFS family permease
MYPTAYLSIPGFREPIERRALLGIGWVLLAIALGGLIAGAITTWRIAPVVAVVAAGLAVIIAATLPEPLPSMRQPDPIQQRFDHPLPG